MKKITAFNFSLIPQITAITIMLFSPQVKNFTTDHSFFFSLDEENSYMSVFFSSLMGKCPSLISMRKCSQVLSVRLYVNGMDSTNKR
jgi:hypothetical protein